MSILNLCDIQLEASRKVEFCANLAELQKETSSLFPGYRLVLSNEIAHPEFPLAALSSLVGQPTGIEQIQSVLKRTGQASDLDSILKGLWDDGNKMERGSLMTFLSRGKKRGLFQNFGRGLWGLPEHFVNGMSVFDSPSEPPGEGEET